MIDEID